MDTEYVLDGAFEHGEITPVEWAVLSSELGAYYEVRRIVDLNLSTGQDFLRNTAQARLDTTAPHERYFFALLGLGCMSFGLTTLRDRICFLVQKKFQEDLGVVRRLELEGLYPELRQRAQIPALRSDEEISEMRVTQLLSHMFGETMRRWEQDMELCGEALAWFQADEGRTFQAMLAQAQGKPTTSISILSETAIKHAKAALERRRRAHMQRERKLTSMAKAAVKKATRLFQNLGQEKNLSLLVSGQEVTLNHPDSAFKFVLTPSQGAGWLLDRTREGRAHTPYSLAWYTKDDVFLANLCVYFENTPVLDQLLALSLYVSTGEELKVLETANWFGTTNWTPEKTQKVLEAYPELDKRIPAKHPEGQPRRAAVQLPPEFLAQETHWAPFKGRVDQWVSTWMEPTSKAFSALKTGALQVAEMQREVLALTPPKPVQVLVGGTEVLPLT